ncbi:MAG: PAS domain S-box protein [Pirellulaceae bacterium]|nr:PAS domain S-box protein [Pirellulaceae bacterium]
MTGERHQEMENAETKKASEFYVVGIGASAGGLEALEAFFESLPAVTEMAFVVIQHLSPDFKSHMDELLSRHTEMNIHRADNGMQVEPNSIYLIPPKMDMVISSGKLWLTERGDQRTFSHPVDQFFRSLASDFGPRSIGVILSGTGNDGSRGVRAIHESGGFVVVQDPVSAKFDGMPVNAQSTGVVDMILTPTLIADTIVRFTQEKLSIKQFLEQWSTDEPVEGVDQIFRLLHRLHGLDFSQYKSTTVGRRIQRRLSMLQLDSVEQYVAHLETHPDEQNELYKDLLIGVTKFFRDPEAFEALEKQVIPQLFDNATEGIRIWVAGCASGEEAYSIAILIDEEIRRRHVDIPVKIFATDAHHGSLQAAAAAVFPEESLTEMSEGRRTRYFRKHSDGYHASRTLRQYIVFAPHNLIKDAPFTQIDLVSCRNLLIYLQTNAQQKALSLFHFALRTGGTLFLGPSESPGELSDEFQIIDKRWRLYTKRRDVRLPIDVSIPPNHPNSVGPSALPIGRAVRQRVTSSLLSTYDCLLDRKMPNSILVDENYDILHTFGGAQQYLNYRSGRPSTNVTELIDQPLRTPLIGALQHAVRKQDKVQYAGIRSFNAEKQSQLTIIVEPITVAGEASQKILIEFIETGDATTLPALDDTLTVDASQLNSNRVATLESELRFNQENLQATIEEMEASNEELQASNEELQSTNEELRSVNEELYTVNAEHQRRVEELAQSNSDMDNLLATTRVGVIFLDSELHIRRFTPEIARIFQLVPLDVGRPIESFAHQLRLDSLVGLLKDVLLEQTEKELEVEDSRGTLFLMRVLPYRTGSQVSGVVMTLIEIETLRRARQEIARFKHMAETAGEAIALIDHRGQFAFVNPALCDLLGYESDELMQLTFMDIDVQHDIDQFAIAFERAIRKDLRVIASEFRRQDESLVPVELSVNSVILQQERFLCVFGRDVTQRRADELEMRLQHSAIQASLNGILITDATQGDNPATFVNHGFSALTGYSQEETVGRNCRFLQGAGTDPEVVKSIREAVNNGEPIRTTLLNYKKDGTTFWNDLQITPIHDQSGKLVNFVGVQHDVSEQIESEAIATRNAERFTAILDTAAEGIYGIDTAGLCTFCNQSALKMLGYEHESDVLGKNMHDLIHHTRPGGESLPVEECKIFTAWRHNQGTHVTDEFFWKRDGTAFPVEYWSSPFVHDDQLRGAIVSFQDITDRLALTSRLEQMGKMIDASHDAIIVWELGGEILSWNAGASKLYGYSQEQALGKVTHELLQTVNPGIWEDLYQSLSTDGEWVGDLEHTTRSGQKITVSSRHQLLEHPNGDRHVLEINRDITQQRRVQKELEQANAAAKEASEAKNAFLANISHELRTPMTAVLGFADILRMESDAPEYVERVDTIKRNGEYLLALLNDILDLSKIEAGKLRIDAQPINTRDVINDVQSLMNVRAAEEGIPLTFQWKSKVPEQISADQIRVRQILVNLIGNAIKFTDEGEVRVTIEVLHDSHPPKLEVAVHDTGIGMTPQQQEQLFTPFSQPSQQHSTKFGGTGLGLSISKRLAVAMGGEIQVQSEAGAGSCFTFSLPLSEQELDSLVHADKDESNVVITSDDDLSLPQLDARVLLADDRRDVWRIGKYFLEKCGADVLVVEDGQQAVDATMRAADEGQPFDLILMDMQMPVMTGRQAVEAIRDAGFTLPIIALTADAMAGERESCIKIGCDEYFPKPIHGVRLMNLVASLIQDDRNNTDR